MKCSRRSIYSICMESFFFIVVVVGFLLPWYNIVRWAYGAYMWMWNVELSHFVLCSKLASSRLCDLCKNSIISHPKRKKQITQITITKLQKLMAVSKAICKAFIHLTSSIGDWKNHLNHSQCFIFTPKIAPIIFTAVFHTSTTKMAQKFCFIRKDQFKSSTWNEHIHTCWCNREKNSIETQ